MSASNYLALAALPSFNLFPWFFVIPGVLIAACAIAALVRPSRGVVCAGSWSSSGSA